MLPDARPPTPPGAPVRGIRHDRVVSQHPIAPVPPTLFDDEREQRWRSRFTAVRMSRPGWARDAPARSVYVSNATGTFEIHAWDRDSGEHRQVTDRRNGTTSAVLPPDGGQIWWFADTDGDEFGHWVAQPWTSGPGTDTVPAVPGAGDGYPAGLEIGRRVTAVGVSTDDGTVLSVHERGSGTDAREIYRHTEDAGVGALSEDETLLAISHSEHGDSRHPSLRVLDVATGDTVAELHDGPGRGLAALEFSPSPGTSGCSSATNAAAATSCWSGTRPPARSPSSRSTCPASSSAASSRTLRRCSSRTPTPPGPGCSATPWPPAS